MSSSETENGGQPNEYTLLLLTASILLVLLKYTAEIEDDAGILKRLSAPVGSRASISSVLATCFDFLFELREANNPEKHPESFGTVIPLFDTEVVVLGVNKPSDFPVSVHIRCSELRLESSAF